LSTRPFPNTLIPSCLFLGFSALGAWGQVQSMTFFKLPGPVETSLASSCFLNDEGTAAATVLLSQSNRFQAYQLRKDKAEILQDLPGYTRSFSDGINNKGEVLGHMTGPGQDDFAMVVWKDRIPTKIAVPPPSNPSNRQLISPRAIDNAGRILFSMSELTPSFQQTPTKHYLLNGGSAAELPVLQPNGVITAVFSFAYIGMNNAGDIVGQAMVTRLGQLQIIGFILKNGSFQEVLVDQLFQVAGISQNGEVFGQRNDLSFFAWRAGQASLLPKLIASEAVSVDSWNSKGQTCARVRVFVYSASNYANAIVSFGAKNPGQ